MKLNEKKKPCGMCLVGLIFVLIEVFIVIGESVGLINYNSGLDSIVFIIFLTIIISFHEKNENQQVKNEKMNMEKS